MTRLNEKRIGDIMLRGCGCKVIAPDCTLQDAVELIKFQLDEGGDTGFLDNFLLVSNGCGNYLGFITFRSVLETLEPVFVRSGVFLSWQGLFSDRCREEARTRVREIMTPLDKIAVKPGDTLSKAVHNMLAHGLGVLPVVEDNRFVGMVRSLELFREIYRAMGENGCKISKEKSLENSGVLPKQHPL